MDTPDPTIHGPRDGWLVAGTVLGWIQRIWLWVGWIAFGLFAARFVLHFMEPLPAVAFFLTVAAFCFPGWVFLSLLWGGGSASHQPELWIWGAGLGMTANIWLALIEGYLTGSATGRSVLVVDLVAIVAWFLYARWRGGWALPLRPWTFGERALWLTVSLWILAFMSHACLPFGRVLPGGAILHSRAFVSDIMAQVSAVASISVGLPYTPLAMTEIPAPMQSGLSLFTAIGRGWMDPSGAITSWVILTNLFVALGFAAVLVSVLRVFMRNLRGLVLAAFVPFFSYGFYWLVVWLRPELITAGSEWTDRLFGPSIYRWMLTSPQALLSLGLGLVAVAWIGQAPRPASRTGMAGFGILAGLICSIDHAHGWLAVLAGMVWVLVLFIVHPHDRLRLGAGALLFGIGCLAGIVPVVALDIPVPHSASHWSWMGTWEMALALPGRLGLVFGPLVILGVWGVVRRVRHGDDSYGPVVYGALLLAALVLLAFYRPVGADALPGLVLLFPVLITGLIWMFEDEEFREGIGRWVVLGVLVLGLPGLVVDFLNAGAPAGQSRGVAIHPVDHEAAVWAREFLPVDAVVQSSPDYRNYSSADTLGTNGLTWAASLAERRMIAGPRHLCYGVPDSVQNERRWRVAEMLGSAQPDSLHARARRLGVDYIYVGPSESQRRPRLRARMDGSPDQFEPVYEQDSAAIFRVYPQ